ncbi:hypothetical protein KC19_10G030800 [Ceratodon purpureus]|uniref:E3 ubiquitin-protein ligase Sina-like RING finger domain-containing protein n=1 Tax=Ceratodon purpureus TaxID=3225 RepID=A0A8T0GN63_CERPU|nr:hypothetical protein KC19_10G030800 [Ceratodon purpureus]
MASVPDEVWREICLKRKYDQLVDFNALDCPIFTEPPVSPVLQCRNDHIASSQCCAKLTKGCPSCSNYIIRCLATEIFLESAQACSPRM